MSMISEQVRELREWAAHKMIVEENNTIADLLFKAADTIEMLSEKAREPKQGEWIIHKINGIPHTVECSHCHQHYDYEELRHLGRSKGCIDIPHCPNCGSKMRGEHDDAD